MKGRCWSLLAVIIMAVALVAGMSTSAVATTNDCYGASCNGLDPEARCNHDAETVGAMHAKYGMLELRWSPSCAANWGRFTMYWRTELSHKAARITTHARVTVWNPNKASYDTSKNSNFPGSSAWSYMTDGTKQACTGVELTNFHHSKTDSGAIEQIEYIDWIWGPCY